jgi:putative hydrolase of the HAD superfamily
MIRAVIFDFGQVISAQKPESLFSGYERELGLLPGTINTIMFTGTAWRDALLGRKTMAKYWLAIGPQLGLHSSRQIEAFRQRYYADEKLNPTVRDLIAMLFGRYRLAVCSNSPPGLIHWLEQWDIARFFDVVFCSGDEGIMKPDEAAYRATVAALDVAADEAVFIDDAWENIEAAARCGLRAIHFTDGAALERELAAIIPLPECGVGFTNH